MTVSLKKRASERNKMAIGGAYCFATTGAKPIQYGDGMVCRWYGMETVQLTPLLRTLASSP